MVYFGVAVDFGGSVGVVIGYFELELIGGVLPVARVGGYGYFEDGEVVGVGEFDVGYFASVEFGNVCGFRDGGAEVGDVCERERERFE